VEFPRDEGYIVAVIATTNEAKKIILEGCRHLMAKKTDEEAGLAPIIIERCRRV
jgi:hypothetical protein